MSHSLNSLRWGYTGDYIRDYYGAMKGDTRSVDYRSYIVSHGSGQGLKLQKRLPLKLHRESVVCRLHSE